MHIVASKPDFHGLRAPFKLVFSPFKASTKARFSVKEIIAEFLPVGRNFTIFAGDFLPVGICAAGEVSNACLAHNPLGNAIESFPISR
jgi:hypothetical protein